MTLTNRAASGVVVTGVRHTSRILGGPCTPAPDLTFRPVAATVRAGASTRVLDQFLYIGGSGCCYSGGACDGRVTCKVEESFAVLTGAGTVEAGSFTYRINFNHCEPCEELGAARQTACPPRIP